MVRSTVRTNEHPSPPLQSGGQGGGPGSLQLPGCEWWGRDAMAERFLGQAPATTKACVPTPPFASEAFLVAGSAPPIRKRSVSGRRVRPPFANEAFLVAGSGPPFANEAFLVAGSAPPNPPSRGGERDTDRPARPVR